MLAKATIACSPDPRQIPVEANCRNTQSDHVEWDKKAQVWFRKWPNKIICSTYQECFKEPSKDVESQDLRDSRHNISAVEKHHHSVAWESWRSDRWLWETHWSEVNMYPTYGLITAMMMPWTTATIPLDETQLCYYVWHWNTLNLQLRCCFYF